MAYVTYTNKDTGLRSSHELRDGKSLSVHAEHGSVGVLDVDPDKAREGYLVVTVYGERHQVLLKFNGEKVL
jgi:hypothetical protein